MAHPSALGDPRRGLRVLGRKVGCGEGDSHAMWGEEADSPRMQGDCLFVSRARSEPQFPHL